MNPADDPLAVLARVLDRLDGDLMDRVSAIDAVRIVQLTIEECGR